MSFLKREECSLAMWKLWARLEKKQENELLDRSVIPVGSHWGACRRHDPFGGMTRVARQRRVYDVLAEEMKTRVHALALETLTPDEARK
ncbi:MAG: BolA family transcriptional regulator [Proteobacteria bacterium]|nr:BolA family transcriptional regulator [Pseudomonadota bacterium]